jgi:hypothetical protein
VEQLEVKYSITFGGGWYKLVSDSVGGEINVEMMGGEKELALVV